MGIGGNDAGYSLGVANDDKVAFKWVKGKWINIRDIHCFCIPEK